MSYIDCFIFMCSSLSNVKYLINKTHIFTLFCFYLFQTLLTAEIGMSMRVMTGKPSTAVDSNTLAHIPVTRVCLNEAANLHGAKGKGCNGTAKKICLSYIDTVVTICPVKPEACGSLMHTSDVSGLYYFGVLSLVIVHYNTPPTCPSYIASTDTAPCWK